MKRHKIVQLRKDICDMIFSYSSTPDYRLVFPYYDETFLPNYSSKPTSISHNTIVYTTSLCGYGPIDVVLDDQESGLYVVTHGPYIGQRIAICHTEPYGGQLDDKTPSRLLKKLNPRTV